MAKTTEKNNAEIIDEREQEAIKLGAKHCIYFGDNEEYRLYLIEITRHLLSPVWNKFMYDPAEAAETLLATVVIPQVSDLNKIETLSSGAFLQQISETLYAICDVKKSTFKKL